MNTLMTTELRELLPPLYSQENNGTATTVYGKVFNPAGAGTWYLTEFDGKDTLFGITCDLGNEPEMGYMSLAEMEDLRVDLVVRDLTTGESVRSGRIIRLELEDPWSPRPVSELPTDDIPKFLHKVDEAEIA